MESNRRTFMKAGLAAAILPQTRGVTSRTNSCQKAIL
jgi:hypothetical protein